MARKSAKKMLANVITVLILCAAALTITQMGHEAYMPDVENMNLADAVTALEDAKVIEADTALTHIRLVEKRTGDVIELGDPSDFKGYTVLKQSPKAGKEIKTKGGLFSKEGKTDLVQLTIEPSKE